MARRKDEQSPVRQARVLSDPDSAERGSRGTSHGLRCQARRLNLAVGSPPEAVKVAPSAQTTVATLERTRTMVDSAVTTAVLPARHSDPFHVPHRGRARMVALSTTALVGIRTWVRR